MTNEKKFHLGLITIILLGLTPLLWFRNNLLIVGGDESWLLDPGIFANFFNYAWNVKFVENAGGPNLFSPRLFPIVYFWFFLKFIGLSLVTIERLWILLLFLLPGLSMYYLMSVIYNKRWARLISSTLYMFNLYIIQVGVFQNNVKPVLIALPLMLAFLIKGLNNKERFLKYAILIGISSLIYAESNANPPAVIAIPIILFLYLIFHIITHKGSLLYSLKFVLIANIFYLLLNLWWLSTFLPSVIQQSRFIQEVHTFTVLSTGGTIEFLRLLGSWAWRAGHYKMLYFPFAHFYNKPFLLVLSYFIPFAVFLPIVLKPKNRNICFFSLLAIIGLFLAKGAGAPFGFLYRWAWGNITGFWTLREPFAKFTPITLFSYSILLGFSADLLYQRAKNRQRVSGSRHKLFLPNLIPILIMIIILIVSYPLITGEVIWDHWNGAMRTYYVKVPDCWHELREWLNLNDKESRVFQSPKGGYNVPYNWEYGFYAGSEPAIVLLNNPTIQFKSFPTSYVDKIVNNLYKSFNPDKKLKLISLFTLLNTKYILQQNDLDWKFAQEDTYSPEQMKKILVSQPGIKLVKSFGRLDLYKIDDKYFLPHIYSSPAATIVDGDIEALISLVETEHLDGNPAIFFTEQMSQRKIAGLLNKSKNVIFTDRASKELLRQAENKNLNFAYMFSDREDRDGEFYVPRDGIYTIRAKLFARLLKKKAVGFLINVNEEKELDRWKFKSVNANYESSIEKGLLKIASRIKKGNRNQLIMEYKKNLDIDLKKYPYLDVVCKVDDGRRQAIEVVLAVDFDGDGKEDETIGKIHLKGLSKNLVEFPCNLLKAVQEHFPDKNFYQLKAIALNLFAVEKGKQNEKALRDYNFYIEKLRFYNPSKEDYFVDGNGKLISPLGFVFNKPLLEIDGERYLFKKKFESKKDLEQIWFKIKDLRLNQGNRKISSLLDIDDNLRLELLLIEPKTSHPEITTYPEVSFRKINPTRYKVLAKPDKPFWLIFSESFHPHWKAYVKLSNPRHQIPFEWSAVLSALRDWGKRQELKEHYLVNGYANAWWVPLSGEPESNKKLEIILEYVPQRLFETGLVISGLTFIFCVGYLTQRWIKRKA